MLKKEALDNATKTLSRHEYYHGSNIKIQSDYLYPRKAFNSIQNGFVSGAFVTSDISFAKFFAINHCIAGEGQTLQIGNKIYLERLSDYIKPDFYIYTVYETPDNPFIHDMGTEYYSTEPIKIAKAEKCDTTKEIEKLGFEIYVLNEPLKSKVSKESGNNFAVQAEMAQAIEQKKFHRVDISKMINESYKMHILSEKEHD